MQRRHFLQSIAVGSVASLHSAVFTLAKNNKPGHKIKVGQIGTKHAHAGGQMQTIRNLSDLYECVGYVEPDSVRAKEVANSPVYRGVPRLTEKELLTTNGLQIVAIETEICDLLSTAQRCIDAGLHIHLDKPAGEKIEPLRKLHDDAERKSLTIQMGYMFRYNPAFQFLFSAARQGWLGEIFEVHGVMSKKVNQATRKELVKYPGGTMFELGCHLIDPLLHLLGIPDNVTCYNRKTDSRDSLYDNMLSVFEYPKATATIRSSVVEVNGGRRRQFIVCGTKGSIEIKPLEPYWLVLTLEKSQGEFKAGTHEINLKKSAGRYTSCWTELAKVVRGEAKLPFSHQHDIAVQKAILAASGLRDWKK